MTRIPLHTVLFILISSVAGFSQTTSAPLRDFQYWNDVQLTVPVVRSKDKKTEKVNLVFTGTLRFGTHASRLADERIGVSVDFKPTNYLTISPGYLYREDQPYRGKNEMEHRLKAEATLEKKFPAVSLKSRTRFEFRVRSGIADSVRFRNRFSLSVPIKKENKELFAPFIADEPYYDFSKKLWSRNELAIGVSKKFSNKFSLDVFYMMQLNKSTYLKEVHAIGTAFRFKIP